MTLRPKEFYPSKNWLSRFLAASGKEGGETRSDRRKGCQVGLVIFLGTKTEAQTPQLQENIGRANQDRTESQRCATLFD